MPTGGCEVQAEQLSDPPAYPVRFKPLLERGTAYVSLDMYARSDILTA
jgi:hypothetical protein